MYHIKDEVRRMDEMNELFYQNAYQREFDAKVISCTEGKKGYEVILEDTAFYPEGGGQPADHGTLNDIVVFDVKDREEGIIHYTKQPLKVGCTVHGVIDWQRRFDHMQQHTGEHILSGLIHLKYGYNNVGFHLGEDVILVDFDGPLTWEEVKEIEWESNQAIWRNEEIHVTYPSEQERKEMNYRSKIDLTGTVRIVEVPGCDVCACCGTHVSRTGEIGLIKCLSLEKHKDGVRIAMVCGNRALKDYDIQAEQNANISHLLSAKLYETSNAVEALQKSEGEKGRQVNQMVRKYFALKVSQMEPQGLLYVGYEEDVAPVELREFGNQLLEEEKAEICALYTNSKQEGVYNYLLLSNTHPLQEAGKQLNQLLNGKGGGKPEMIQGSYQASKEEIESAFLKVLGE